MKKKSTMKKQKVIRTRNNYEPGRGTKINGVSMAIQNETLSVAQLLLKHINGTPVKENPGVYIPDADHDDIDGQKYREMDLAEKEDIIAGMKAMRERLGHLEREYQDELKRRLDLKAEGLKNAGNEVSK